MGCEQLGQGDVVRLAQLGRRAGPGVEIVGLDGLETLVLAAVDPAVHDRRNARALRRGRSVEDVFTWSVRISQVGSVCALHEQAAVAGGPE